jgi:hypothetical protein
MVRTALLSALLLAAALSAAQDYGFSVPEMSCRVEILRDRSISIDYDILFRCERYAHPIDVVDIGFPTEDYDLSSIVASVDGTGVKTIMPSTYIDVGVEVHLGGETIYPETSGRFRLSGINREMVWRDTETEGWASVEFTPTWFGGDFLAGTTDFSVTVIFPEGAGPDSVRYHGREFTDAGVDDRGRVWYTWEERRRADGPWEVGVSFPGRLVDGPLRDRPRGPLITGEQATKLLCWAAPFILVFFFAWAIVSSVKKANRRKVAYLPPKIGVEGSGIRRGLTAPLAAMLLEERLDRVLVLILYGLLRKGALELHGIGGNSVLRKTGAGTRLREYETAMLEILPEPGTGARVSGPDLRKVFVDMVESLEQKMEGFSLEETREYYRHIIANAWELVSRSDSAEKAGSMLADRFEWLFADAEFSEKVEGLPEVSPAYFPVWFHSAGSTTGFSMSGGLNLSQVCANIAGTLESAANSAVGSLTSLSASVTSITNPIPVSTSSYSGGHGSSCACACACAGCACACAGGGR